MSKKDKFAIFMVIIMITSFIISEIYIAIKNKPQGYSFRVEKIYYDLITKKMR